MLRAIMRVIRRVLAAAGRGLIKVGSLFGRSAPAVPSLEFEELADEHVEELRHELVSTPEPEPAPVTSLGTRFHAYAAADADGRAGFDFGAVPDDVALTLVSLTEAQLARLAAAGPVVCGRWARGERTGLVGVPMHRQAEPPGVIVEEGDISPAQRPAIPA